MILPPGIQGVEAGEEVEVHLYKSKAELEHTIFCIGSHDLTLDLLAQFLAEQDRRFVSANVGSQGGLLRFVVVKLIWQVHIYLIYKRANSISHIFVNTCRIFQ